MKRVDSRVNDVENEREGKSGYSGYPGRYYAVLRNTRVIPAIFESKIERVTCRMEP